MLFRYTFLEKQRGITIFSKQAVIKYENTNLFLLDTPGHIDFSTEMERTLKALDYGLLVINGSSSLQSHTFTLWRLLKNTIFQPLFLLIKWICLIERIVT